MAKYILAYGTIRSQGEKHQICNFGRCGKQFYIKTMRLKGFDMFSVGPWPVVTKGEGSIVAELHQISDETFLRITAMELHAGYEAWDVKVGDVVATIFMIGNPDLVKHLPKIKNGDWCSA